MYIQEEYGSISLVANSAFMFTTVHTTSSIIVSDTQNLYTASDVFDSVFPGTYDTDFSNGDSTDYHLDPADTTYAYNKGHRHVGRDVGKRDERYRCAGSTAIHVLGHRGGRAVAGQD